MQTSKIVDQFNDPSNKILVKLACDYPDLVKQAKSADLGEDLSDSPGAYFGWEEMRKFPIHTKEHATLSYLYAKTASEHIPQYVLDKIENSLEIHGIEVPQLPATVKVAATHNYLLPAESLYAVDSREDLAKMAMALPFVVPHLDLEARKTLCSNFLKTAETMESPVPDLVRQLAGTVVSSVTFLKEALETRATIVKDKHPKIAEKYAAACDKLGKAGYEMEPDASLQKLANYIGDLDKTAGLDKEWDKRVTNPQLTVFNTTKRATTNLVDLDGSKIAMPTLMQYDPSDYAAVLGDDVLSEITSPAGDLDAHKMAMVLPTLPLSVKRDLKRAFRL